jgi:hypothetical protein
MRFSPSQNLAIEPSIFWVAFMEASLRQAVMNDSPVELPEDFSNPMAVRHPVGLL